MRKSETMWVRVSISPQHAFDLIGNLNIPFLVKMSHQFKWTKNKRSHRFFISLSKSPDTKPITFNIKIKKYDLGTLNDQLLLVNLKYNTTYRAIPYNGMTEKHDWIVGRDYGWKT